MDESAAMQIANTWYDLVEDEELRSAYNQLAPSLRSSLPNDTEAAAAVMLDGRPSVLALAGDGLFIAAFEGVGEDGALRLVTRRIPLSPTPTIRIHDGWRADSSKGPIRASGERARDWKVTWPDGRVLSFESIISRMGGFHPEADGPERFGRALAARIGWQIPGNAERGS